MKLTIGLTTACAMALGTQFAGRPSSLPQPISDNDYYESGRARPEKVELGRQLFFDKVLSGNQNIACATCHHPELASTDRLALGLGEGPAGLGPDRKTNGEKASAVHGRVPRNSPALFNLGAAEFTRLFHDGRVEADPKGYFEGGFITPAKWKLPTGLDNVLAAQAMFPVTSPDEMAGQKGENPIADAVSLNNAAGPGGAWEILANRLKAIPRYVELFKAAYPAKVKTAEDVTYVLAANAIAAFETEAFRADESRYDAYLRGARGSLTASELRGIELFYGKAGCDSCHSGKFLTDHEFHALAMPQIGPGKADGRDASYWRASGEKAFLEDFGRGRVTVREEDRYKFKTPSLRNVALTGPWGHDGAYDDLKDVVRHHLDPIGSLERYDPKTNRLPTLGNVLETAADNAKWSAEYLTGSRREGFQKRDTWVMSQPELRQKLAASNELEPNPLTNDEIDALIAFLHTLTDYDVTRLVARVPTEVPSGLPVLD